MPADQGLIDSVANSNTKTIAESSAWSTAQAMAAHGAVVNDYTGHRARLNLLGEKALATSMKGLNEIDAEQAVATLKLLTGNDLAQIMSSLGSGIAQIQQVLKGAQSTPPETAVKK